MANILHKYANFWYRYTTKSAAKKTQQAKGVWNPRIWNGWLFNKPCATLAGEQKYDMSQNKQRLKVMEKKRGENGGSMQGITKGETWEKNKVRSEKNLE